MRFRFLIILVHNITKPTWPTLQRNSEAWRLLCNRCTLGHACNALTLSYLPSGWHRYTPFQKTTPLKQVNQTRPVVNKFFSEDASAFNCKLTAFEKLDMGWVPTARFPWEQQHHAGARVQEANTRHEMLLLDILSWRPNARPVSSKSRPLVKPTEYNLLCVDKQWWCGKCRDT